MVERVNRVFKETVQMAMEAGESIQEVVAERIWCYLNIPHSTTGITPFALLRGRNSYNELSPKWVIDKSKPDSHRPSSQAVRDKVQASHKKVKSRDDDLKKVKEVDFAIGDWVRIRRPYRVKGSKYFPVTKVVRVSKHSVMFEGRKWWSKRTVVKVDVKENACGNGKEDVIADGVTGGVFVEMDGLGMDRLCNEDNFTSGGRCVISNAESRDAANLAAAQASERNVWRLCPVGIDGS
ncbi:hypothetical protein NDU88_006174 [Pleurodeles waltl]|uniref:Integrase catalytic domain-containing protein n=1 Tax=Pleurodeles waltl TaxID=8319 RepID=A0AAV7LZG0_PLEWA|nr:hypothetical protein NDU88_006174 [Pleurodeles waltl]